MRAASLLQDHLLAQAVLARLDEAVLVADDEMRVLDANPTALALLGRGPEALVGASLLGVVPPEAREEALASWVEMRRGGGARGMAMVLRADGARREVAYMAFSDVLPGRHVALLRDVTEARANERQLEAFRRQLAQTEKLGALGTLTSGVAHEVRTPLTFIASHLYVIRGRLDRALAAGQIDPQVHASLQEHFREAGAGVDRINQLVLELRRFTRLQPGSRQGANLDEVVRDAARLFETAARSRLSLRVETEPVPAVPMDVVQVQQVVLNLLENAADAQPYGGEVRLRVRAAPEGGEVVVEDRGAGIPPEVAARMFEAFYTTRRDGTGLGLSIVKRIVDAHGGRVWWEPRPGGGTRFGFTLPRPPAPAASGGGTRSDGAPPAPGAGP